MRRLLASFITVLFVHAFAPGALDALAEPAISAASCHAHHGLPDLTCTPGVRDRQVTQSNIERTICRTGYTDTVRPPSSYTTKLKRRQLKPYGYYAGRSLRRYEEDHLISLELGGSPTSPKNLWPEAYLPKPGARQKDGVESYLHHQVCSGAMTLRAAQHEEAANWVAIYRREH
jgi:hypothetical protein